MKFLAILLLVAACSSEDPQPVPQQTSDSQLEVQAAPQAVNEAVTKQFNPPAPYVCQTDPDGKVADFIRTHPTDPHAGSIPHGAVVYTCSFGEQDHSPLAVAFVHGELIRWAD